MNDNGNYELSCWFGLSRASWCALPRVLMEAMPDEWQYRMAVLLNEYSDTFDTSDVGVDSLIISAKFDNKFTKMPEWVQNYRRPDKNLIESLKRDVSGNTYRYDYVNFDKIREKNETYLHNLEKFMRD